MPISAEKRRDQAKAAYESELLKLKTKRLATINAKYDALDTTKNVGKRRQAKIETSHEERYALAKTDRLRAVNLGRDAERNFSPVKSIIKQFKVNVVGPAVKLRMNLDNAELGNKVSSWFNGVYAKNCDARDDLHLTDLAKLALASIKREGDVGVWSDDEAKLLFFETDQFCEVEKADWDKQTVWVETVAGADGKPRTLPLLQEQGVVYDRKGRRRAFVVSREHGRTARPLADVSIIPAADFKLMKSVWRLNQYRGTPDILPMLADSIDLYEMRSSELQSAKVASKYAGAITRQDAMEQSLLRSGTDVEGLLDEPAKASAQATYEAFEQLTGGFLEYLEPGDKVDFFKNERPNSGLEAFFDFVLGGSGASLGLAKTYTSLDCEKSYFAARGDMLLSWAAFLDDQKWMERHFFDWVAVRAIRFHASEAAWELPEGWESKMSWDFPKMPLLDELKKANTDAANLDNLLTDYAELLGPDWQEKMIQRKKQEDFIFSKGLARVNRNTGGANAAEPPKNPDQEPEE